MNQVSYSLKLVFWCFLCSIGPQIVGYGNDYFPSYRFKSITVNDNLSHSDVNCIMQDSLGYIWIGTNNGLNRFDGYHITTFKYDLEDTISIPGNRVKQMVMDRTGQIWVALENKGLFRFYPKEMIFREVALPFPTTNFVEMLVDDFGDIWLNKNDFGLCRLLLEKTGEVKTMVTYPAHEIKAEGEGFDIRILRHGELGLFFVTSDNDIWHFDKGNNSFEKILPASQLSLAKTERINCLFIEGDQIWVGTNNGIVNIRSVHFKNNDFSYQQITRLNNNISPQNITHIFRDRFEKLWLGTTLGLFMVHPTLSPNGLKSAFSWQKMTFSRNDITSDRITYLFEDRFGVLWVGSTGGVNYTNLRQKAFVHLLLDENVAEVVTKHIVYAVHKAKDGKIWIGTRTGLNIYDPEQETMEYYKSGPEPGALKGRDIAFIYEDSKGDIWLGIKDAGLSRARMANGQLTFERWPITGSQGNELVYNPMLMAEDREGRLWITTYREGIFILDENREKFANLRHDPRNANSLSTNNLTAVYCDPSDGTIWISSRDGGLNRVRWDKTGDWQFKSFRYDSKDPSSISSDHTWQIYRAQNNQLWVATLGGGLNKVIEEANGEISFVRYTIKDGLIDNDIESLAEDEAGNLWLAGVGLSKFNPTTGRLQHFDYQDGLQSNSFKIGAVFKDEQGVLYFGGINGINYFDPKAIVADDIVPAIYITGLRVNSSEIKIGQVVNGRVLLEQSLFNLPPIRLQADENDFSLDFVGLQFASSLKNQYQYKLEGLNDYWVSTKFPNLRANYSNIPPGDYTFKVRASNGDGVWNEMETALSIHIASPWYATPLAFGFYAIAVAFALFLFQKNTEKQLRLKNELILAEKEKELHQSKLNFFTNISHELRSPLTLIKGPLEELLFHPKVRKETKAKLRVMQNSATRLLNLMNQLLDFRKMETGNMRLQAAKGNFVKFTHELFLIFSQSASEKNIQYHFESPLPDIQLAYDRDKMETVLMNLLSNAYKFTPEHGRIAVHLHIHGDEKKAAVYGPHDKQLKENYLLLSFSDSGMGMDEKEVEKVFNPYYQVKKNNTLHLTGTGIGLSLVKGVMDLHKGEISVSSEPTKGTTFSLKLPFGIEHLSAEELIPDFKNSEYIGHYIETDDNQNSAVDRDNVKYLTTIDERIKKYRVMIVEDNGALRNYLRQVLETDFMVEEAVNGQEALEMIMDAPPDLVVSDVMMPVMDGIRLCKCIKENELTAHLPVILLTARTSKVYELEGMDMGAESYITKPFNAQLLKAKMMTILKNREHLREYYRKQLFFEPIKESQLSPDEKLVHQAIQIIEANLEDADFNVQKLAEMLFQSQSSLYRKVKTVTDKSLVEFVRDVRLRKAAQLIQQGELSITEIAYQVGFSSIKYFRQCFKKQYDMTPSAYSEETKRALQPVAQSRPNS
ncbi:MAG: two-component regulator propeller domain-containing protein [Saprospiraceae bacterium]